MSEAVALIRRSTDTPQYTPHTPETEIDHRAALSLVRRLLRDAVVIPVNEVVVNGLYQRELA